MNKAAIGKIAGAIGLLILVSSAFTYVVTADNYLVLGKVLLGLALIVTYLVTNFGQLGQFASSRSTFFVLSSAALVVVLLAGLGAVNYIAAKKNKTWDLTNKKIYSLAPQTQTTLAGLKDKVTALAFLPPEHPYRDPLEQILKRYHDQAPEKFAYAFEDPRKRPDLAKKYELKDGQITVVLTRGEGANEAHTTLSVVSEQEVTNALIKLNGVGNQKVYVVYGHGEFPLEATGPESEGNTLGEMRRTLVQEGYAPEGLQLAGATEVPKDAALLIVAGARTPFTQQEASLVETYLDQGGRLLYFAEANVDAGPHLAKVLSRYGVEVDPGMIADARYAVDSPYQPLSAFYAEHEATRLLQQMQITVQFATVRGLSVIHTGIADGVTATPLVTTSPYAWEESQPNDQPEPSEGEKQGQIPMVVAVTRPTASAPNKRFDEARLVVFGDSELLVDVNWGHEGNRNLVMNTLGWASNQIDKITIRPPDRDVSTIDMTPERLGRIRFLSMDVLPITLLGIGLAIWLKRRSQ